MWAVSAFAFGPGVLPVATGASQSHVAVWRLNIPVILIALSGAAEGEGGWPCARPCCHSLADLTSHPFLSIGHKCSSIGIIACS